jgi:hypothetical protein
LESDDGVGLGKEIRLTDGSAASATQSEKETLPLASRVAGPAVLARTRPQARKGLGPGGTRCARAEAGNGPLGSEGKQAAGKARPKAEMK